MAYKYIFRNICFTWLLLCPIPALADDGVSILSQCIEREDSMASGHLEFECNLKDATGNVLEQLYIYFEWSIEGRCRIGYTKEAPDQFYVSDGANTFCTEELRNRMFTFLKPLLDKDEIGKANAHTALQFVILRDFLPFSNTIMIVNVGAYPTYTTLDWILSSYSVYQAEDESIKEKAQAEATLIFEHKEWSGLKKLYEIDVQHHLPTGEWDISDFREEPFLFRRWIGSVQVSDIWIPERVENHLETGFEYSFTLLPEKSWIGDIDPSCFELPKKGKGYYAPLLSEEEYSSESHIHALIRSINHMLPIMVYISLIILLIFLVFVLIWLNKKKTNIGKEFVDEQRNR